LLLSADIKAVIGDEDTALNHVDLIKGSASIVKFQRRRLFLTLAVAWLNLDGM